MYDGHIYCEEYKELYDDVKLSSTQYDDLMNYVQDM
jgi:hypothetical protein